MVKITNDHLKLTDNLNQYSKVPFTGTVILWTGSTSPDGALLCNGKQYEVADYPVLAEFLGYPSTDTYFNVPNFNNRIPIGADNTTKKKQNIDKLPLQSISRKLQTFLYQEHQHLHHLCCYVAC